MRVALIPVLRGYQEDCVRRVRDALRRCRRVLLQSPTGSGKTVMFCWLAMAVAAHAAKILILGHRQEIVDQISAALTAFEVPHGLIAAGRPEIAAAVQIASVMTLINRLDRYQGSFDLLVIDEAHHSTARSWRRILDAFPDILILGVSATPQRFDGRGLDDIYRELVIGPTVTELVALGFLSPAVTFAPPVPPDLSGIKTRAADFEQEALAERMSGAKIVGDAVEHYKKLSPQLPGLAYGVSIAHSEQIAASFCAAGYRARHVDGTTPADQRRAAIAALGAGKLDLISNCGRFTEGFDVPVLACILVLHPTQSLGLYLQMTGRALRTAPGKLRALILDHASNSLRLGLYDFPHRWSLEGREKRTGEALVRRCPECGTMVAIRAPSCPECGFVFVPQQRPITIPQTTTDELEMVDGRLVEQLRRMPSMRAWHWAGSDIKKLQLSRSHAVTSAAGSGGGSRKSEQPDHEGYCDG